MKAVTVAVGWKGTSSTGLSPAVPEDTMVTEYRCMVRGVSGEDLMWVAAH